MELADTVEQMQFTAAGTSGFLEEGVREEELDSLDRLGPVSPEVAKYIQQLQSKLLSTQKVSGPFFKFTRFLSVGAISFSLETSDINEAH
jgi:hypothetical protein